MPRAKSLYSLRDRLAPLVAVSLALSMAPDGFARNISIQTNVDTAASDDTTSDINNSFRKSILIADNAEEKEASEDPSTKNPDILDGKEQAAELEARRNEEEAEALAKQKAEAAAWNHFDLAHFYESRFDLELADTEFEQAILNLPTLKIAHRDYCILLIGRLNLAKAVAEFMLATGLGEPVPYTPFEKAELDARAAKLHYRKALVYGRANSWAQAITELKWAELYAPANPAIKRSLAFAYASSGQFEAAERQYADSFVADPGDAYSHADFAFLLSEQGKGTNAINQMSKAVELEPRVAALHVDLAWFSEKNGDLALASKELQAAVKLSPNHAVLWSHLGRLSEQLGDTALAKKAYTQALTLDPQLAEAKAGLSKSSNSAN